jgi:hypothetical protein
MRQTSKSKIKLTRTIAKDSHSVLEPPPRLRVQRTSVSSRYWNLTPQLPSTFPTQDLLFNHRTPASKKHRRWEIRHDVKSMGSFHPGFYDTEILILNLRITGRFMLTSRAKSKGTFILPSKSLAEAP